MQLLTNEIKDKAKKQYKKGSSLNQDIIAKFFDPTGSWTWYLMNIADDEDYAWGIVKGHDVEMGSFSISELKSIRLPFGLSIERDKFFKPIKAKELYDGLIQGKHY